MPSTRIITSLVILLSLVYRSESIRCYYCNSANNTACLDVNMYDEELRSKIIPIVECQSSIPGSVASSFFCRKIVQTVFHPHRDSEVRITRGCGWVPHEKECYKDDNTDHLGTYCQCFGDLCNGARAATASTATVFFMFLVTFMYFCGI